MIKQLFFTAALLVPGLAYAGAPSATLPGQIVPAGSGPAVPAQAAAAGFTTLAANFDFVNNQMCVYDGRSPACVAASPTSNWLDCANTDSTKIFHPPTTSVACDAASISLQNDGGTTVLQLHYDPVYGNLGLLGNDDSVAIQTVIKNGSGGVTFTFPQGFYYEATYRIDTVISAPNGAVYQDSIWSWNVNATCAVDLQLAELFTGFSGGHGGAGSGGWCPSGANTVGWVSYLANNLPPGWSETGYNKYGGLRTHDGSTSMPMCMYVNDVLQKNNGGSSGVYCNPNLLQSDNTIFNNRVYPIIWVAASDSSYSGAPRPTTPSSMLVKNVRVWSCASWPTQDCRGTTEYNDGNLIYWH